MAQKGEFTFQFSSDCIQDPKIALGLINQAVEVIGVKCPGCIR